MAAASVPAEYEEDGRDGLVMRLLVAELAQAPVVPLSAPFPQSPALAARCHAFLERPTAWLQSSIVSCALGRSRKAWQRAARAGLWGKGADSGTTGAWASSATSRRITSPSRPSSSYSAGTEAAATSSWRSRGDTPTTRQRSPKSGEAAGAISTLRVDT